MKSRRSDASAFLMRATWVCTLETAEGGAAAHSAAISRSLGTGVLTLRRSVVRTAASLPLSAISRPSAART